MNRIYEVLEAALANLTSRQRYAADVIGGWQRWSGADIQGKAARYGASYMIQRGHAQRALRQAGGQVIPCEHGLLLTAVYVGMDDYGNPIMQTLRGCAVLGNLTYRHV